MSVPRPGGIPARFKGLVLDDVVERGLAKSAKVNFLDPYLEGMLPVGKGLMLVGPPGSGKTLVGCCVMNEIKQATGRDTFFVRYSNYVRAHLDMMDLKSAWEKISDPDAYAEWYALRETLNNVRRTLPIVLIDDVGDEHETASGYARDEFVYLMRFRYDRGLPTILTTNLTDEAMQSRYGQAMFSFIHEAFVIIATSTIEDKRRV